MSNVRRLIKYSCKKKVFKGILTYEFSTKLFGSNAQAIDYGRKNNCEIWLNEVNVYLPNYNYSVKQPNGDMIGNLTKELAYEMADMWAGTEVYHHLTIMEYRSSAEVLRERNFRQTA